MRPPSADLPAYLTSEMEARSEEEKELMARSMHFQHRKGGAAIRYFYEDGLVCFRKGTFKEREEVSRNLLENVYKFFSNFRMEPWFFRIKPWVFFLG